jgi:hypothetical protein
MLHSCLKTHHCHQEDAPVLGKRLFLIPAILGLMNSNAAFSQQIPSTLDPQVIGKPSIQSADAKDQNLANQIAKRLQESGLLHDFKIEIKVSGGNAELEGVVGTTTQKDSALSVARQTSGLIQVVDKLQVLPEPSANVIIQSAQIPMPQPFPGSPGNMLQNPGMRPMPANGANQMIPEPIPVGQSGASYSYDMNPPKMPPYAWPSYAPHNNYSRVGYPEAYPANAWPFIGPVYPFPKVPLGWRSVKLEWDDGHWWFSQTATKHNYWKLRYW